MGILNQGDSEPEEEASHMGALVYTLSLEFSFSTSRVRSLPRLSVLGDDVTSPQ